MRQVRLAMRSSTTRVWSPVAMSWNTSVRISYCSTLLGDDALQLVPDRVEEQVGQAHAVHRGDEGDRDAGAQARRVGQVFHHVDQAQHGAQDADRRRIAGRRFPDARRLALRIS
jgi:hypothetical protein